MTGAAKWLGSLPVVFISGFAMLVIGLLIRSSAASIGGDLLDFQMTGADAIARLHELRSTLNGIEVHQFISGRLDMAYPLAYGLFFASLAIRFSRSHSLLLAVPMALAAGFDVAENLTQLQGLAGDEAALGAKSFLTPVKFAFVALGMAVALWICGTTLWRRRRG